MRYEFVDNARAIALLLVIGWHCNYGPNNFLTVWVLPMFFIIMGAFYKHEMSLLSLIVKKVNGLIIPWIFFALPACMLSIIGVGCFPIEKIYNPYACINGPSWFLLCMFWSYLLFWIICELSKKIFNKFSRIGVLVISFLTSVCSYLLDKSTSWGIE